MYIYIDIDINICNNSVFVRRAHYAFR